MLNGWEKVKCKVSEQLQQFSPVLEVLNSTVFFSQRISYDFRVWVRVSDLRIDNFLPRAQNGWICNLLIVKLDQKWSKCWFSLLSQKKRISKILVCKEIYIQSRAQWSVWWKFERSNFESHFRLIQTFLQICKNIHKIWFCCPQIKYLPCMRSGSSLFFVAAPNNV